MGTETSNKQTSTQIVRLTTLEEHRAFLINTIKTAKQRVIIVSPFITSNAVKSDRLENTIKKVINREVSITIYTDDMLNRESDSKYKTSAIEGVRLLKAAGARVITLRGIHNKTIICDDYLIAEGSFNWLSAVREKGNIHRREERSIVTRGEIVAKQIENEIKLLHNMEMESYYFEPVTASALATKRAVFARLSLGFKVAILFYIVAMCFVIYMLGSGGTIFVLFLSLPVAPVVYKVLKGRLSEDDETINADDDPYLDPEYKGFTGNLWNDE